MAGLVSFHALDLDFFDGVIEPLVTGGKTNPESYLDSALHLRGAAWTAQRYKRSLAQLLEQMEPPELPTEGTMWEKVRARLERLEYKPDPMVRRLAEKLDPDLHLYGRPFLNTEGSPDRVAALTDEYLEADSPDAVGDVIAVQLTKLVNGLPDSIEVNGGDPTPDMAYRAELLRSLRQIYDMAEAARNQHHSAPIGGNVSAVEALVSELPWRALHLYSRAVPFWIARGMDGLEGVCRAAGITPPDCLIPAERPFARACDEFPGLREHLKVELEGTRNVGAFVAADRIPDLLTFLGEQGSAIIQAATRHGEGPACITLLRKIRECAHYAQRHQVAMVEAVGIVPVELDPEEDLAPL